MKKMMQDRLQDDIDTRRLIESGRADDRAQNDRQHAELQEQLRQIQLAMTKDNQNKRHVLINMPNDIEQRCEAILIGEGKEDPALTTNDGDPSRDVMFIIYDLASSRIGEREDDLGAGG